jgi:hypothetical protein
MILTPYGRYAYMTPIMSNIVDALRRELAALKAELENDPRHRKIARIRSLLAEYEASTPTEPDLSAHRPTRTASLNSKKRRVHDGIVTFLAAHPGVHRSELLADLKHRGLMGDEKDPMASLAAYLSDFRSELQNVGQGHWSLRASTPDAEAPEPMKSLHPGDQTGAD